jgi:hypothetical protein
MNRKVIFLILMLLNLGAYAQDTSLSRLVNIAAAQPVEEKVYLHLNKYSYYPGDTIWYKAYTLTANGHSLSSISGVLYAELIGPKDTVITRQTLRLAAGITWGEFALPRKTGGGIYRVRAYTNWMRNNGEDGFFDRPIRVLGPGLMHKWSPDKKMDEHPDVQFLPEGGELVAGLRSKIAFKAVSNNGLGVNINGSIVDNDGNVIADFASQHLGMGVFALTPQPGKAYYARINIPGENSFTVDLPKAVTSGCTLSVDNREKDSIYVKVAANDKLLETQAGKRFCLVGQSEGRIYYTTQGQFSAQALVARVERSRFPSGIVQFTLFTGDGRPVNERAIFVRNNDMLKLDISGIAAACLPGHKVQASLTAGDGKKLSSLSVSVINENRVPFNENDESTILNYVLLTSDLKGHIEQPNYYFTDVNETKLADLDLLMLTQGYTRFEWHKILSGSQPRIAYEPESALQLEGTLMTPSGKPVPKGKVTLVATHDNLVIDTVTDMNGNFRFAGLNLSDTSKIVVRARKANNGSNLSIFIRQPEYPPITNRRTGAGMLAPLTQAMNDTLTAYRQQQFKDSLANGRILNEVTIKGKKLPKPDEYNGYGALPEYDADMKKLRQKQVVTALALTNVIPGLTYSREHGFYYNQIPVKDLIIDGITPDKPDAVDFLSVKELESVRVIGISPSTLVLTTKRYAGTDTVATVKLKTVTINAKREKPKPDLSMSSNLHGGGNADQVIMYDQMGDGPDIASRLLGKINFVSFDQNGVPLNNRVNFAKMAIIVDGMVLSGDHLSDISADDVYSIEVLRTPFATAIYGSSLPGAGALVITTKRGIDPGYVTSTAPAGLITYPFKGFHVAKVFYSPKYDHTNTADDRFDSRTAIYWNPNIITDKDGKTSFEYYNADTKGTYRIVVEGIDENGRIGRQVYRYQVK